LPIFANLDRGKPQYAGIDGEKPRYFNFLAKSSVIEAVAVESF
jgi:hypothetical protein